MVYANLDLAEQHVSLGNVSFSLLHIPVQNYVLIICVSTQNTWTLHKNKHEHTTSVGNNGITMYFDDMSNGVDWNPEDYTSSSSSMWSSTPPHHHHRHHQPPILNEQEMIQRILTGYDAETARQLSCRESE